MADFKDNIVNWTVTRDLFQSKAQADMGVDEQISEELDTNITRHMLHPEVLDLAGGVKSQVRDIVV